MNLGLVSKALGPLLVGGMAAGATWIATGPVVGVLAPEARAWIDTPLDGAVLPVGAPVEIVAHATDKDGVALVTLTVDGAEETTVTGGGGSLVTVPITWDPPGKGTYELEVIGEDAHGGTGDAGSATVTIGDAATQESTSTTTADGSSTTTAVDPGSTTTTSVLGGEDPTSSTTATTDPGTPTTQPSSTTTRPSATTTTTRPTTTTTRSTTTTTRPTTTTTVATTTTTTAPPCQAIPPSLASPSDGAVLRASPTLSWVYQGCPIDGFRVEVRRVPTNLPVITSPTLDASARSWAPPDGFACDGRPWYWRVAALAGRELRWSTMWSFTC